MHASNTSGDLILSLFADENPFAADRRLVISILNNLTRNYVLRPGRELKLGETWRRGKRTGSQEWPPRAPGINSAK
jgi:hypothetical protein